VVSGNITGLNITIGGALTGNIVAEGEVTIGETARVTGNISCTGFAVGSGAIFNGRCHMAAPIRLEHGSEE
jgi:cytoskeletal protein CcmA (bactofilin family)